MDSTRRHTPLDIFRDADASFADYQFGADSDLHRPALHPSATNILNQNILLEPDLDENTHFSPLKQSSPGSSPPANQLLPPRFLDTVHFGLPESSQPVTDSVPKKPSPKSSYKSTIQRPPKKALFNTLPASRSLAKENPYVQAPFYDSGLVSSDAVTCYSPVLGKRQLPDTPHESNSKKQKAEVEDDGPLPDPQDLPSFTDDGTKPPYSYASLIGFAIMRAPNRRLTLSQIYKWISDTFSFYKDAEAGWTNSIRHNLSLNKAFVKKERPKDEPGKGHYWCIVEGMERQFLKDKPVRRTNTSDPPPYFQQIYSDGQRPSTAPHIGAFSLPPKPTRSIDSVRFPAENEISSDATLPASDDAAIAEEDQDQLLMPPPPKALHSSPPPADMGSSPPVALPQNNDDTPPPQVRFSSMSRSGTREKRRDAFRDSGFFSSIESSATRPNYGATSGSATDIDQERPKKSGRAEEEIARIRGSSYDPSPIKNKPVFKHPSILASSSPLRLADSGAFPLTPGLRLKPSRQPPPSVSPMTYLRRHRENVRDLVGTPVHGRSQLAEDGVYSPAFNIHEDNGNENDGHHAHGTIHPPNLFDFQNTNTLLDEDIFGSFFARGSPVKSSVKRPILKRAPATASILEDVTNSGRMNRNPRLASPIRMLQPSKLSGARFESPLKRTSPPGDKYGLDSPQVWPEDDIWKSLVCSSDEDEENFGPDKVSMDLFKGFQPIGTPTAGTEDGKENEQAKKLCSSKAQKVTGKRPPLGRSITNVI